MTVFVPWWQTDCKTLEEVFERHPNQKEEILESIRTLLNIMAEKALLSLTFIQKLLWDFFRCATAADILDFLPHVREAMLALLSSREGCFVASTALGFGGAKVKCSQCKQTVFIPMLLTAIYALYSPFPGPKGCHQGPEVAHGGSCMPCSGPSGSASCHGCN